MVKIRLRRIGTKGRPFYRVVVAKSTAGRNGTFVESIGSYDPVAKTKLIEINKEKALHWLLEGAQPTETVAVLLNKTGVLDEFFSKRPSAKKNYSFLDKRTAATSVAAAAVVAEEPAPAVEAPAVEAAAPVEAAEPATEAPAAEAEAAPEATPEA